MLLPQDVKVYAYNHEGRQVGYLLNNGFYATNGRQTGFLNHEGKYFSLIKGKEGTEIGFLVSKGELNIRGLKVTLKIA